MSLSEHKETSLEKGLHTLLVLSKSGNGLTVSDLSTTLGYPVPIQ